MLTKDISQELESVILQLVNEGKEPTVALIKARLSTKIPIPAIVTTIKRWKSSQQIPKVEVAVESSASSETEQRIARLEQQIADLVSRVAQLEQQSGQKL
ncbi:hypothetical protein [Vibrio gazogenes]|uniref:KfrA N-terminal DNA-binding domain-containing protein n=1 Tax=Vibrio gazogenes DSM 21264 = NBRC 103151 TaxID=1123492 RepID=A0A1M5DEW3_VIBGA|nr:hypothetical protein [Vibrio gazogenes]USP14543.1 hypothetical protein MKS89_04280 [Vibrio gazogenes]SHF65421.1 hypothetical protein SAMN02745781_02840 [Vibrio gazogenes DSM 21264] [Vibrio gazogenes DSM 21264 = NBRC 103151]SJN55942.1 hypothetical protein BQ6471_01801 [Vibrio gazogenes]